MIKKLNNIGDCGIVCDFGEEVNREINTSVIKLFHHVKQEVLKGNLKGILNYTPSYNKLIINFNLYKIYLTTLTFPPPPRRSLPRTTTFSPAFRPLNI